MMFSTQMKQYSFQELHNYLHLFQIKQDWELQLHLHHCILFHFGVSYTLQTCFHAKLLLCGVLLPIQIEFFFFNSSAACCFQTQIFFFSFVVQIVNP